jgi:hypothetical protein
LADPVAMNPSRPQDGGSGPSGAALPLEAFVADAQAFDAEGFAAKHGSGFLLVAASNSFSGESTSTRLFLEGVDEEPGAHTADLAVVVYRLRPKDGPAGGHLVTIGRDSRHDASCRTPASPASTASPSAQPTAAGASRTWAPRMGR